MVGSILKILDTGFDELASKVMIVQANPDVEGTCTLSGALSDCVLAASLSFFNTSLLTTCIPFNAIQDQTNNTLSIFEALRCLHCNIHGLPCLDCTEPTVGAWC